MWRRRQASRSVWCRTWLARRTLFKQYDSLMIELNREDPANYKNFLRVEDLLGEILHRNSPNSTKKLSLVIYGFLPAVYGWLRVVASGLIVTSYLRVIYGKINPWTLMRRFMTCQKICLSFHGSSRVSASCAELFTDNSELLTDAWDCLRVGHP